MAPHSEGIGPRHETIDGESQILAPDRNTAFDSSIAIPEEAVNVPYDWRLTLRCSDLAGFSKHSFTMSD